MTPPLHYSSRALDWQPFDPWGACDISPTVHDSLVFSDTWGEDTAQFRVQLCSVTVHIAGHRQMEGALYLHASRYDLETAPEEVWFLRRACISGHLDHEHKPNAGLVTFPVREQTARDLFAVLRKEQLSNIGVEVEGS